MYKDTRLAGVEKWYHLPPKDAYMRVPDNIPKCICYLCYKIGGGAAAGKYNAIGTGFIVKVEEFGYSFIYVVTARHVIDEHKRTKTDQLYLRLNTRAGGVDYFQVDMKQSGWIFPEEESIDLAFIQIQIPHSDFDFLEVPIEMTATLEVWNEQYIGIGDEIFVTGLFTHRKGLERNFPIVRTGIISAMPFEAIYDKKTGDYFPAFLAELRSIGGLSGSPVFIYLNKYREPKPKLPEGRDSVFYLLGIIRGHWELDEDEGGNKLPKKDSFKDDVRIGYSKGENLNVGIGLVTPAHQLWLALKSESVRNMRKQLAKMLDEMEDTFVEDSSGIPEESSDAFTKDSFENALKKVSRKTSEPDEEKKQT
ncbi:MAG: serine protease [Acidobacteriota bacterium]|nr:serine protease [Acidobacteriota bacterium]